MGTMVYNVNSTATQVLAAKQVKEEDFLFDKTYECPVCSKSMKSVGKGQQYRCRKCHTKSSEPVTRKVPRCIVPGWYEPPTSARRHLSKPLKRMGFEQPVEFVNGRI